MSSGYPTFRAAAADAAAAPIVFAVEGDDVPFTVPRPVPAIPLLDMAVDAMDQQAGGQASQQAALAAFHRFLQGCLGDQWGRFRRSATRAQLGVDQVLAIVQYVVSEATGRPTTPPSASVPGWPATGQPSMAGQQPMAPPPQVS